MPSQNDVRIYLDLEYCYPGMTAASGRPNDTQKRQVVQIAAIRFDHESGSEIDKFDQLVIPAYEQNLPAFFVELTGITQSQLDRDGIEYPSALLEFVKFCGDDHIYTYDKDWSVLKQNAEYFDIPFPYQERPFIRVKPLLSQWGIDAEKFSSGTLYKAAGLSMTGHVHNALHDVRSMARALRQFDIG